VSIEDLQKTKSPNSSPRSIRLFLCNNVRLRNERKPLAEGPKKHLPFARIVRHSVLWDPSLSSASRIYTRVCVENIFRAIKICVGFVVLAF
jgi:hypothetical protein